MMRWTRILLVVALCLVPGAAFADGFFSVGIGASTGGFFSSTERTYPWQIGAVSHKGWVGFDVEYGAIMTSGIAPNLRTLGAWVRIGKRFSAWRPYGSVGWATLGSLGGEGQRGYAADFSDPWHAVLDALLKRERDHMVAVGEQVVLAAAELTTQVVTFLERARVLAVITETGGRFSHGAVLARSFGIPCVVGLSNLLSRLEQGMRVCVDGDRGTVQLKPADDDVDQFLERLARRKARESRLVFIGRELPEQIIRDGFESCITT
jgi:phosphohistidine swiveling domain-containing protein